MTRLVLILTSALVLLLCGTLSAVTFPVVTNADAVPAIPGSLRDAINMANAAAGKDTIIFMIATAMSPPVLIQPVQELPALLDPAGVLIDGFTQAPGGSGTRPSNLSLTVQLDGGAPVVPPQTMRGLHINSSYNEVRGLIITNFQKCGINIHGSVADHQALYNTVHFNIIGLQGDGSTPAGNGASGWHAGVSIDAGGHSSDGQLPNTGVAKWNVIEHNLISENTKDGVSINGPIAPGDVSLNTVQGNYIGTDQPGSAGRGNHGEGVCICEGAHDNLVRKNLISDNYFEGVGIQGYGADLIYTHSNRIDSNVIGLDVSANPLGNGGHGVGIGCYDGVNGLWGFAADNRIGPDNVIAKNRGDGVYVWEDQMNTSNGDLNQITRNSIYDNVGLGIDLQVDGVTNNDVGDPDNAANQEMNFPIFSSAIWAAGGTVITGTCEPSTAIVEVFKAALDPTGAGEGRTYLGDAVLDGFGGWTYTDVSMILVVGDSVTATSTDGGPNTSEFTRVMTVSAGQTDDWDCYESPPPGKSGGGYEKENNNDCSNANDAACEMAYCGGITPIAGPDEDWWMLTIPDDGIGTCNCLHIRVFGDATSGTVVYGGGLDPEVTVYTGDCPSALTQVMYNDDYYGQGTGDAQGTDAQIDCDAIGNCFPPGTTVYVKITAQNQSTGDYLFVVNCEPCECPDQPVDSCTYYKPGYPDYAPNGMPDFDQKQGIWQPPMGGPWTHCGPVALANCLWWFDSKFEPNTVPPPAIIDNYPLVTSYAPAGSGWDDHDAQNVIPFVDSMALYSRTNTVVMGTRFDDLANGAMSWLAQQGLTDSFTVTILPGEDPEFPYFVIEEVNRSQDVILLIGFWEDMGPQEQGHRVGGHYVTMAGTCIQELAFCISDPFFDMNEGEPPAGSAHGSAIHNDAALVSGPHGTIHHDKYYVTPLGVPWMGPYQWTLNYPMPQEIVNFFGQNEWMIPSQGYQGGPVVPVLEGAIIICPVEPADTCLGQMPGDFNSDGVFSTADVVFLINHFELGGPKPFPAANGDANGDCIVDNRDIDYLNAHMFGGGPPPVVCTCVDPHYTCCKGITGEIDGDAAEVTDIGDLTALINYLFNPPFPLPVCWEEANIDGDAGGIVDIGDLTRLINYLFNPPFPLPEDCL